jgi:hypothetical protein
VVKVAIDGLARAQPEAFKYSQVAGQAYRDGGKYDVKRNGEPELYSGKQ